jgi:hypothetical protein
MKTALFFRCLLLVECFIGGCLTKSGLESTYDSLFLVLLSYPLWRIASSIVIKRKYREPRDLVVPRFDGPLFFKTPPLQVEMDAAYMAFAFGVGAILANLIFHQRVSYEGLIAIGLGGGEISASFAFVKRHKSVAH